MNPSSPRWLKNLLLWDRWARDPRAWDRDQVIAAGTVGTVGAIVAGVAIWRGRGPRPGEEIADEPEAPTPRELVFDRLAPEPIWVMEEPEKPSRARVEIEPEAKTEASPAEEKVAPEAPPRVAPAAPPKAPPVVAPVVEAAKKVERAVEEKVEQSFKKVKSLFSDHVTRPLTDEEARIQSMVQGRLLGALDPVPWPYLWGGGKPGNAWKYQPVDCSGLVSLALERIGAVPPAAVPRWNTQFVKLKGKPVKWGDQRPGDIVIYTGHVAMVWSYPNGEKEKDSAILEAIGGSCKPDKDDCQYRVNGVKGRPGYRSWAHVRVMPTIDCHPGFQGIYRVGKLPTET